MERPRRLSYAGLAKATTQKSRRVSDVGQSGISHPHLIELHDSMMHHDSRYDSNMNRSNRRTSRPSREDGFTCSQQSVLSAMDRFVKAVNNMDSTVLVPSRLQDMDMCNGNVKCPPPGLMNADVYPFFMMLKDVKNELLWGPSVPEGPTRSLPSSGRSSPGSTRFTKHVRQPSDDSLGSAGFPSDQETDSDLESVITDRDSVEENSCTAPAGNHLASAFRHHLLGLHTILHELADSADFLCNRYQEEVEAP